MKVVIDGCNGMGSRMVDTDYILQKNFWRGMIIVAVHTLEELEEEVPRCIAENIMEEWERNPELTSERLKECMEEGMTVSDKVSVTIWVVDGKYMGVAHRGSNKVYGIRQGRIVDETQLAEKQQPLQVILQNYVPVSGDAFLIATDGFWEKLAMTEVLIDYTKSNTPKEWISYLSTRVGLRMQEENDCYSAIAVMME